MTASERRRLAGILVVALLLRVCVALAWSPPLTGDAADYHRLAAGLAEGRGYVDTRGAPTAFRPPVYPLFLAGIYRGFGEGGRAVGLAQAVVGTATVAAMAALTAAVLGSSAGLVAAALVAVDVAQLAFSARRLSEGLFTLLLALVILCALRARARLRAARSPWGWAAAAGVLGALATLTRGLFVGFPLVLAAALVLDGSRAGVTGEAAPSSRPRSAVRRAAAAALVLIVAYGAGMLPWTLRNVRALGEPVPVATQGGITLYSSWFPPNGNIMGVFPDDAVTRSAVGLSEPEQSRHFVAATAHGLARDPGRIPRLLALKTLYLAAPLDWEVLPRYGVINPTYVVAALWAAAFVLGLGRGLRAAAWPLWLPLGYVALTSLVFYGSPRLRAPVDPFLEALAAGAMVELARRRGSAHAAAAVAATAATALALALFAAPLKLLALAQLRRFGLWRG